MQDVIFAENFQADEDHTSPTLLAHNHLMTLRLRRRKPFRKNTNALN